MELFINSQENQYLEITLCEKHQLVVKNKIFAQSKQAELLLPTVKSILVKSKIKLNQLEKIKVADSGGSFTSLRIGIVTANALAYALNIGINNFLANNSNKLTSKLYHQLNIIKPKYDAKPNIKIGKNMI